VTAVEIGQKLVNLHYVAESGFIFRWPSWFTAEAQEAGVQAGILFLRKDPVLPGEDLCLDWDAYRKAGGTGSAA
jgi:hypothetical protein